MLVLVMLSRYPPLLNTLIFSKSANVIESIMATADEQLQRKEKARLMRKSKCDTSTNGWIDGDRVIGRLIRKLIMLIPMSVDPRGQLGPFMTRFLYGISPKPLTFQMNHSNAEEMYQRLTTAPCPSGILMQATINWKKGNTTRFYGGSRTTPIPQEYTMQ